MTRRYDCHAHQCTWRPPSSDPDPARDELLEHAIDAGHPLCTTCHLSLRRDERATCEKCITHARRMLHELTDLYALLPIELGQLGSAVYDRGSPNATDGDPLAHVDILTLLARGAAGGVARRLPNNRRDQPVRWWVEGRHGPLPRHEYQRLTLESQGREHHADNLPADPSSVDWWLASWEEQWARALGDTLSDDEPTLTSSAGYLEKRTRQGATDDPDLFALYVTELRQALDLLRRVTHRVERALRAPVRCFDCGSRQLERRYVEPTPCRHVRISQRLLTWEADDKHGLGPRCETPLGREQRLERWTTEHKRCQQGGLAEEWTCTSCRRTYDQKSYFLTVRDRLENTS